MRKGRDSGRKIKCDWLFGIRWTNELLASLAQHTMLCTLVDKFIDAENDQDSKEKKFGAVQTTKHLRKNSTVDAHMV